MTRFKFVFTAMFLTFSGLLLQSCYNYPDCNCEGNNALNEAMTGNAGDGTEYRIRYHELRGDGTPDFTDSNGNGVWDTGEPHGAYYVPLARAQWARDAAINTHDQLRSPIYNFKAPTFINKPNTFCITDLIGIGAGVSGASCGPTASIDDDRVREGVELFVRAITAHELFHQTQYSYVDEAGDFLSEVGSYGMWLVEGTPEYMVDKLFWDLDSEPGSTIASSLILGTSYLGRVRTYLGNDGSGIPNPSKTLMQDHTYTAALFWNYLCEQMGNPLPEPARGVDFLQQFFARADGQSPATIRYLESTIDAFSDNTTSFQELFHDFTITNYTHRLNWAPLAGQEPDWDRPRRDYDERYTYFDEQALGGGSNYGTVTVQAIPNWGTEYSDDVNRWAARYFEINPNYADLRDCELIGFSAEAEPGVELGWALIGTSAGQVRVLKRSIGPVFNVGLLNYAARPYDRLGLVVTGLNQAGDFTYTFDQGPVTMDIHYPTSQRVARVGEKTDPQRFLIRMQLDGPDALRPEGAPAASVQGIDMLQASVTLEGLNEYPATIISQMYVDGEYRLAVQAPIIVDPNEVDVFNLRICLCTSSNGVCMIEAISSQSVRYGAFVQNQMVLIDRSGSMGWYDGAKFDAALNSARMAIDAAGDINRIGIATFWGWRDAGRECEEEATLSAELQLVGPNRNTLISAVQGVTIGDNSDGWTSIGDGLVLSAGELLDKRPGFQSDEEAILLLSDGLPNRRLYWEKDNSGCAGAAEVRDLFGPGGPYDGIVIYAEGLGPDADIELLRRIAGPPPGFADQIPTEARHSPLSSPLSLELPNRLAESFRRAQEDQAQLERLYYGAFDLELNDPIVKTEVLMEVEEVSGGGVEEAAFVFNWNKAAADVKVELLDPDGNLISTTTDDWIITEPPTDVRTNKVYHYTEVLAPGIWTARIWVEGEADQVMVILSGRLKHGVETGLSVSQVNNHDQQQECPPTSGIRPYLRGLPVQILFNIHDISGPVRGVQELSAVVHNFKAEANQISLYDDGAHGDGAADDGIYGGLYTRTPFYTVVPDAQDETGPEPSVPTELSGIYRVFLEVTGENNAGETFRRTRIRSFSVMEYTDYSLCGDPDTDGDGLPDRWENWVGLDPADPGDAILDQDNDGLDNTREFFLGTHPLNPDTDAGGQGDGSEYQLGQDPLYDQDDQLPSILNYGVIREGSDVVFLQPKPHTNMLFFPADPAYTHMQIWRTDVANPDWGDFIQVARVDLSKRPRGVYSDTRLTSGVTYNYYLVAEGVQAGVLTAPTAFFTGTPK